jgi:pilus assembly protein TadC
MIVSLIALLTIAAFIGCALPLGTSAARHDPDRSQPGPTPGAQRFVSRRRRERLIDDAYPDALDLFVVSVQAGHLPFDALISIGPHVHSAVRDAIAEVAARVERGQRLADALEAMVEALGTRTLAFVATVALAERTGLAVAPMIDRIADDARLHRRRRAEAADRELPVRLAVPLVLCTLPSFVLVAIAPLLIGALSSLRGT